MPHNVDEKNCRTEKSEPIIPERNIHFIAIEN